MSAQDQPTAKHYTLLALAVFGAVCALPYAVSALLCACEWFGL